MSIRHGIRGYGIESRNRKCLFLRFNSNRLLKYWLSVVEKARLERRDRPWYLRTGLHQCHVLSPSSSSIGLGRLEPIQAYVKKNKRGLGADEPKKATIPSKFNDAEDPKLSKKKAKGMSKKLKKMQEFEKQLQEKELERAFFREFWPDNV